jgi:N-acetylmuramoyl-L-alanine amidase
MKTVFPASLLTACLTLSLTPPATAQALAKSLTVVYPPTTHETTAKQIFLIGSAPKDGQVLVNGKAIERSPAGHFAPSFPLQIGENQFTVQHPTKTLTLKITRKATTPTIPKGANFAEGSLQPSLDIARLPGEPICLSAIAPPNATVQATLATQTISLQPQQTFALPDNKAVLTGQAQKVETNSGQYAGCVQFTNPGTIAQVDYKVTTSGQTKTQTAPGKISILNPIKPEVIEVTADAGVARTGASTDFSRLSPLPKGTRATVTGQEGEWVRLDYGGWIKRSETKTIANAIPPRTMIRGVTSRPAKDWTEVIFPLQNPVPTSIQQDGKQFTLSLFNTTAQTDTIKIINNPVIDLVNWQQTNPNQIDYRFQLKSQQQWGYKLRYEGTNLILSLKNPPILQKAQKDQPLKGIKILIDPGHGGPEDSGSVGPTGYPEKDATLFLSKLVRDRLVKSGATVIMTREGDIDLLPNDRAKMINQQEPTIALSIHFNALPDDGDAIKTSGVSMFWYHPQAHSLADFLHDHVTRKLGRKSDGVFWNNLAVTRPAVAPSILLELGYMINPVEFEWIRNPQEQQKLADVLADGVVQWFNQVR